MKWFGGFFCGIHSANCGTGGEDTLNTVRVDKINVDEEQELAQVFRVMSIPTLVVIKNGKVEKKAMGVQSKQALLSMLQ
ncbi:hypothetical protein SDC9_144088 [bioreactor metagenome]|uniref:Thioredoxin domain-containing protein n=1 Tax=bioreactor metagenome TaxID=1076179 RepID=A0A645E5V4_9ZZZZ|nr:thioredoxin domain-containing protein [Anaerotignum propionicum]MEA5056139.1 thioredoxin domain-containing protein [Anaerotignum propionicum]